MFLSIFCFLLFCFSFLWVSCVIVYCWCLSAGTCEYLFIDSCGWITSSPRGVNGDAFSQQLQASEPHIMAKTRHKKKVEAKLEKPSKLGKRARNKEKQRAAELTSKAKAAKRNGRKMSESDLAKYSRPYASWDTHHLFALGALTGALGILLSSLLFVIIHKQKRYKHLVII